MFGGGLIQGNEVIWLLRWDKKRGAKVEDRKGKGKLTPPLTFPLTKNAIKYGLLTIKTTYTLKITMNTLNTCVHLPMKSVGYLNRR